MRFTICLLLAFSSLGLGQDHWVSTWAASPQAPFTFPGQTDTNPKTFQDQTVRMIVRSSIGGQRARLTLSNAYGTKALAIGAAHIALRDKESAIVPSSDRVLNFGGKPSFIIPPGALAISDPVDLDIPKLADLVISVYVPSDPGALSQHSLGLQTTYIVSGDATGKTALADPTNTQSWYWISSVDVLAPANYGLIVAFGDSITDGATSTPGADRSWPSFLAARLQANAATAHLAVVNQGISGNGVLSDIIGTNALARFDRDVLMQAGVKYVTILEGINDIGVSLGSGPFARPGSAPVTAEDLIAGYKQLIERAHARGLKVIGCTLTPYVGAAYASEKGETIRSAVNDWIRSSGAYDAVIDFDAVTRDAANPKQLRPSYNLTDHLHPNDAGYKAMADAIDVSIFADKPAAKR